MALLLKTKNGEYISRPITHPATDAQVNAQLRALSEAGALQIESKRNLKITAHRGYHVDVPPNTLESFIAAVNNGFEWLEIDVRKTADGIYVLGHDATVTMYDEGVSTTVTFDNANYSIIKDYTWDLDGEFKLATFSQALNVLKVYDAKIIVDKKSGSNDDILREISQTGMADSCFLSFTSASSALDMIDALHEFNTIGVRLITNNYDDTKQLISSISNPILSDINATSVTGGVHRKPMSISLSLGIPIMFSGCAMYNKNIWNVIASGVMANESLNISYSTFLNEFKHNVVVSEISCQTDSISLSVGQNTTIAATTDTNEALCYIFAYPIDGSVVTVEQSSFGNSISAKIIADKVGTTKVRLFTGSGTFKDIDVVVS